MSLLEVLQFIGYGTAAALHLWMGALLLQRRRGLEKLERVLLLLALSIGLWHASNLIIALHGILGLDRERWVTLLRFADTLAASSITLSYSFLLHVHLHLWATARGRGLTQFDRLRVFLSYLPAIFIPYAIWIIWTGAYVPMFRKLEVTLLPFAIWAAYVLVLISVTDVLISRFAPSKTERNILRLLAASFVAIGALILLVYGFGFTRGTRTYAYLQTIANLGSLLPSALIAYYIYRYRYLELIIKESLIVASFAAIVLAVYLIGIRLAGGWIANQFKLRQGAVETLLILALVLAAAPMRQWIERRFHRLFEQEATLYRDVIARIGSHGGRFTQLPELLRFVESETARVLGFRRLRVIAREPELASGDRPDSPELIDQVVEVSRQNDWRPAEGESFLRSVNFEIGWPLRRDDSVVGVMLVDASRDVLTLDARAILDVLAKQIAIAIEDSRLVTENIELVRRLAHRERLAALGQMAATVAHEVKNPLSAIKSIVQVMQEDKKVVGEYARDITLIVSETDRLSATVTQLLSFARTVPPAAQSARASDLLGSIVDLNRADAAKRDVAIALDVSADADLDGTRAAALRDALTNLILNAIQATPTGGRVRVETSKEDGRFVVRVADEGSGVPTELRERIWEPFFTTRQRGTGLGLAIVRKRMEETGGTAHLIESADGRGACFELRVHFINSNS